MWFVLLVLVGTQTGGGSVFSDGLLVSRHSGIVERKNNLPRLVDGEYN